MIKPNCKNCYYSSCYSINERLASCNCSDIEELKEIKHGLSNSQWVRRDTWDEICNCKFFIPILVPMLNSIDAKCALEISIIDNNKIKCPFCNNDIDINLDNMNDENVYICSHCRRKIALYSKE